MKANVTGIPAAEAKVFKTGASLKDADPWIGVHDYRTFTLDQTNSDGIYRLEHSSSPQQFLMVLNGLVTVKSSLGRFTMNRRDFMVVPKDGVEISMLRKTGDVFQAEFLVVSGDWESINVCTIFQYRPERTLELHYHDYNEYWFIYRGQFEGQFGDQRHNFVPGDMLAIPAGVEHGEARPLEGVIEGVGFSTQRIGRARQGHLLRNEHGEPKVIIDKNGALLEGAAG